MKKLILKMKVALLCFIIFLSACTSKTMIYSSPPANIYIGGKLKGETPYLHKDLKLSLMSTKVRLEKEGYKTKNEKIRRSGKVSRGAILGALIVWVPILWVGSYKTYYAYTLSSKNSTEKYKSDFTKYKEPFKLETKINNPIYIGEKDNTHYVYHDNQISVLSSSFKLITTKEVFEPKSALSITPIDAFIENDEKYILGINEATKDLKAIVIDNNGNPTWTNLTPIVHKGKILCPGFKYGYNRSAEGNEFIAYNDNNLSVFDFRFNLNDKYSVNGSILEAEITSDGRVFSLEVDQSEVFFDQKNDDNKRIPIKLVDGRNMNYFRMNIDEKLNKAFITYLISPNMQQRGLTKKEQKNLESEKNVTEGVVLLEYDLNSMKEIQFKTILLNEKIMSSAQHPTEQGLKYIINQGVIANKNSTFINLEEQWIVEVTSDNSYKEVLNAAGIITINANKPSNPMIYIPKTGLSSNEYNRLSFNQILKNDKLHYLFNDNITVGTRAVVQQVVVDSDLNYLSQDVFNLYKEEKTLLNTAYSYPLKDGSRLIFHMRKKKFGAGVINFD